MTTTRTWALSGPAAGRPVWARSSTGATTVHTPDTTSATTTWRRTARRTRDGNRSNCEKRVIGSDTASGSIPAAEHPTVISEIYCMGWCAFQATKGERIWNRHGNDHHTPGAVLGAVLFNTARSGRRTRASPRYACRISALARVLYAWTSTRMHRGSAPGTSISAAHNSGT